MDLALSGPQMSNAATFDALFDEDMVSDLRRMGNRELGAGADATPDPTGQAAREMVWQTLAGLGGLGDGLELADQVLLAAKMGAALYQSPWNDTLTATALAAAAGRDDLAAAFASGPGVALAVRAEAGAEPDRAGPIDLRTTPGHVRGVRQFVSFGPDVAWLLVIGQAQGATRLLLVPAAHGGVSVRRHDDLGRGDFYEVTLRDVPLAEVIDLTGPDGAAAWDSALVAARIRHAGYLLGLARAALDETVTYARERRQFGQPIGRFQGNAFRLADAATSLEAARLLVHLAAWQADAGQDARLSTLQALATIADLARSVSTDAVQLHGAIGMTEEHDAQLFYRRAAVDALLFGRPTELRRSAAVLLAANYR